MATTFSAYLKAPISRPAHSIEPSRPVLSTERPSSSSYYSSYGESEGTPTPEGRKPQHPRSRPAFSSDPSSPTFYSTPPPAQMPRDTSVGDSSYESDDVYDQFDLGDFTKEEIKRYEAMVGPGERLRDAASPEKPPGPAPKTTGELVGISGRFRG